MIRGRAAYHDIYKLVPPYSGVLFKNFGKGLSEESLQIVGKMNRLEKNYVWTHFYVPRKISVNPVFMAFEHIITMADGVDRGMDPIAVEEFGREMVPAGKY